MSSAMLSMHEGLGSSRRIPGLGCAGQRISAAEWTVLLGLGLAAAALSVVGKLSLGVPGHNIIRVIFPIALGLALVPRRGAGSIMGLSGGLGALLLAAAGPHGLGTGAATSLIVTGMLLDVALWGAREGRSIYVRLAVAGLAANLAAFAVRGGSKLVAGGQIDGLPLELWLPRAAVAYPVCGLLAGLISAAVWFRASERSR